MKPKFNLLMLILFFCIAKVHSIGKSTSSEPLKVIISCLSVDPVKISGVKKGLKADSSVSKVSYCSNHSIFLVELSGSESATEELVQRLRKELNFSEQELFVKQFTFGDIESFCEPDATH